jgi:uncharacterized protein YecT (DUF1311 family)
MARKLRMLRNISRPASARLLLLALAVVLSGAGAVPAADKHPIDAALEACLDQNQSTIGLRECLDAAYRSWDDELNAAYKALMATLPPEAKTALRTAQRQWIGFKDAERTYLRKVFENMDGTIWPVVELQQYVDLYRKRALQLRCSAKMTDMAGPADPQCP